VLSIERKPAAPASAPEPAGREAAGASPDDARAAEAGGA
jgi:hypothetical protein